MKGGQFCMEFVDEKIIHKKEVKEVKEVVAWNSKFNKNIKDKKNQQLIYWITNNKVKRKKDVATKQINLELPSLATGFYMHSLQSCWGCGMYGHMDTYEDHFYRGLLLCMLFFILLRLVWKFVLLLPMICSIPQVTCWVLKTYSYS